MLLMYACGLRITEAATLEVTAIDGINGFIRVIGKGNKERQVPLPQPVLAELRSLWKTVSGAPPPHFDSLSAVA
jgi:site-specific recombinase XerD